LQITRLYYNRVTTFPIDKIKAIHYHFNNTRNIMIDMDLMENRFMQHPPERKLKRDKWTFPRFTYVDMVLRSSMLELEYFSTYTEELQHFEDLNSLVNNYYWSHVHARAEIIHHKDLPRILIDSKFNVGSVPYCKFYASSYKYKKFNRMFKGSPHLIYYYYRKHLFTQQAAATLKRQYKLVKIFEKNKQIQKNFRKKICVIYE
jgi:hypothetical protein